MVSVGVVCGCFTVVALGGLVQVDKDFAWSLLVREGISTWVSESNTSGLYGSYFYCVSGGEVAVCAF
jgi:hypothetical protein